MKKKTIANLVMVALILVIVAAGVLGAGFIRGWFDADDGSQAVLREIVGVIRLEREGVSFPVTADTVLRDGDQITCKNGATAVIYIEDGTIVIGENAAFTVTDAASDSFAADVRYGTLFANCGSGAVFTFEGHSATVRDAVVLLSVRSGAQTLTVLAGSAEGAAAGSAIEYIGSEITVGTLRIQSLNAFALTQIRKANQTMTLCVSNAQLDQMEEDRKNALQDAINNAGSLNPTEPEEGHVHSYVENVIAPTCTEGGCTLHTCACGHSYRDSDTAPAGHTWGDWVTVIQPTDRQEGVRQRQCLFCDCTEEEALSRLPEGHVHSYTVKTVAPTCTTEGYTLYTCACGSSYKENIIAATGHHYTDTVIAPTCVSGGYTLHTCACGHTHKDTQTEALGHNWSDWVVTKEATTDAEGTKERTCQRCGQVQTATIDKLTEMPIAGYVYITIRCDTILDNMDNLNPAKVEFVPADGQILPMVSVYFYEGETVFDVLKRVCEIAGIQLEYSWTPLYGSYYIEGINNLYEFDCGNESGWMYKVNEWFPNYGCSSYSLVDGDVIVWCYTCNGLGADVGDVWVGEP